MDRMGADRIGMEWYGTDGTGLEWTLFLRNKTMAGYEQIERTLVGVSTLMVHNPQTADPTNLYSIEMKKITSKGKKKTEDDMKRLARVEWEASLYLGDKGEPIMPGECLEALIRDGAKDSKNGKTVQSAVLCDGNFPILYSGPKTVEKMWKDGRYHSAMIAVVNRARIVRNRAIFPEWKITFIVSYLPDVINVSTIDDALVIAGHIKGLCEYRPRYGRFEVYELGQMAQTG